tara:strand:- start:1227 stop:1565 length:339 start_codon:yes stop_codon:yes gene_type:complete
MLYKIKKAVYYNPFSKEYQKILTINKLPPSSSNIYKNIKILKNNKLTPYDSNPEHHCLYAFCDSYELLEEDNIDILIEMLIEDGYSIEYKMTTMLKKGKGKYNDLLFLVSKN